MTTVLFSILEKYIVENSKNFLFQHKDDFARIAQEIYDEWDEDEDEYAGGGICHLIADGICDFLIDHEIPCTTVNTQIGENHVFTVAKMDDGVYEIDIPPFIYETGSGYNWQKKPDVEFTRDDVNINLLDSDPDSFERDYLDEY